MDPGSDTLLHSTITNKILKSFFSVYDALPYGIPESAFHRSMQIALADNGLRFETEKLLPVVFRGQIVGQYRADLVVERCVIVEIKSAPRIVEAHLNQIRGYLQIARLQVGLILNFGPQPKFERYFLDPRADAIRSVRKSEVSEGS